MEIKYFLKSKLSLKHSGEYFNLPSPPRNTCPLIESLKNELKAQIQSQRLDPNLLAPFLVALEDYRASCDSIRKEVMIAKESFWHLLGEIFPSDWENKKVAVNLSAEEEFLNWYLEPYTEAESEKLDRYSENLMKEENLRMILEAHLPMIKGNILNLNQWRESYFNLINTKKEIVLEKVKEELVNSGIKVS